MSYDTLTSIGATLKFSAGEARTYYYLVYLDSADAPNAETMKSAGTSGAASAGDNSFVLKTLSPGAAYKVYIALKDAAGNISDVSSVPFTTIAAPVISTAGKLGNIYDKNTLCGSHRDIVFSIALNGNTVSGITGLTQGTHYTVSGDSTTATVTILSSYLDSLKTSTSYHGNYSSPKELTFTFSDGSTVKQSYYVYNTCYEKTSTTSNTAEDSLWPGAIELDSSGNLYYSDIQQHIIIENTAYDHTQWGIEMKAGYSYIIAKKNGSGFAFDTAGNLYITYPASTTETDCAVYELAATNHSQWGIDMVAGETYRIAGGRLSSQVQQREKKSRGESQPRHFRGLSLMRDVASASCSGVTFVKSVPLEKNILIKPLMFSLLASCHGDCTGFDGHHKHQVK